MSTLLSLLILVSLIAMVVGLVKPGLVIRWGEKKTRPRVLMIYGGLFIVFFIALAIILPSNSGGVKLVTKAEESQAKPNENKAPEVVASKEPEIKYNLRNAEDSIRNWMEKHDISRTFKLSLEAKSKNDNLSEVNGNKYHKFVLSGFKHPLVILVDPFNGELSYLIGKDIRSLDKWYEENKSYLENYINESFEWVEKPRGERSAIVGKVKNISNKTISSSYTEFNLYNNAKERIGNVGTNIDNLRSGDIWSFSIPVYQTGVSSYEFVRIKQ